MFNDHQAELDVLKANMDLNEDDSIIDLATRVRARLDANEEMDRRILERLSTSTASLAPPQPKVSEPFRGDPSNLEVGCFLSSLS